MDFMEIKTDLQAVDTSSLVEKVEEQLVDYLVRNNMRPGDAIPKEMELANLLGVSRTVVREAMSRLRMIGLIETKKKKG
ncbi:MAG: FadR/GntR family transcriptional regulator, partial [Haliscomenobacter sp.]